MNGRSGSSPLGLAWQASADDQQATALEKSLGRNNGSKAIYCAPIRVFTIELVWLSESWSKHQGQQMGCGCCVCPNAGDTDIGFRLGRLPYVETYQYALCLSILTAFCGEEYGFEAGLAYFGHTIKG